MDAEEYQNLYFQLEDIINDYELGWILEQVNNSIREGKIVSIEEKLAKKNQAKTPRIKREDYTAKEKVLLLLDAFERAVLDTLELEKEVGKFLTEEMSDSKLEPQIKFCSEEEEKVHEFIFSPQTIRLRQQEAGELQTLLNSLRQELEK